MGAGTDCTAAGAAHTMARPIDWRTDARPPVHKRFASFPGLALAAGVTLVALLALLLLGGGGADGPGVPAGSADSEPLRLPRRRPARCRATQRDRRRRWRRPARSSDHRPRPRRGRRRTARRQRALR